jgi:hypothetical protein
LSEESNHKGVWLGLDKRKDKTRTPSLDNTSSLTCALSQARLIFLNVKKNTKSIGIFWECY